MLCVILHGLVFIRIRRPPRSPRDHTLLPNPTLFRAASGREVLAGAVRRPVASGHRRIGFVRGPAGFRSAAEREEGFRQALAEAGLDLPAELYAPGNYRYTDGIEAGEALLSLAAPPTAVFCSNDEKIGRAHV